MAIHGSLKTMPLAEILVWMQTNRHAGQVTITRDGHEWGLGIEQGNVCRYWGPEFGDRLGHIVVSSRLVTEIDLRRAMQYKRNHECSLYQALVDADVIPKETLDTCLKEIATESIYDLFIDVPGEFLFAPDREQVFNLDMETEVSVAINLHVNHLLMEGARRHDEWQRIRERYPRDDLRVHVHQDKMPALNQDLTIRDRRVLSSLSVGQTLSSICFEMGAPIPSVLLSVVRFQDQGIVEILESHDDKSVPSTTKVSNLVEKSGIMRDAGQFDEAVVLIEAAVNLRPEDMDLRNRLKEALTQQVQELYRVLPPVRVPQIIVDEERIGCLRLRPEERFLLNRLKASMDVGSLVMVSSMSERETLKTLRKLLHSHVIELS